MAIIPDVVDVQEAKPVNSAASAPSTQIRNNFLP
jgi:hypothetical protein